jgi:acyl-CoA-binding protein
MSQEKVCKCLLGAVSVFTVAAGAFYLASRCGWLDSSLPGDAVSDCEDSDASEFAKACAYVRKHGSKLSWAAKLRLYGLYKQAAEGDAPRDASGVKGAAWASAAGLSREEAKRKYAETVSAEAPCWKEAAATLTEETLGVSKVLSRPTAPSTNLQPAFDTSEGGRLARLIVRGERSAVLEALERDPTKANVPDVEGRRPLHWAADQGEVGICEDLMRFGAEISAQCFEGDTPLHMAAVAEEPAVIELLVARGARGDLKNKAGETPEETAGNPNIRKLIRRLFFGVRFPRGVAGTASQTAEAGKV